MDVDVDVDMDMGMGMGMGMSIIYAHNNMRNIGPQAKRTCLDLNARRIGLLAQKIATSPTFADKLPFKDAP